MKKLNYSLLLTLTFVVISCSAQSTTIQDKNYTTEKSIAPQQTREEKAVKREPTAWELYQKAMVAYRKGDYTRAKRYFSELVEKHYKSKLYDNALFWLGQIYYKEGRYKLALKYFDRLIRECERGLAPDCNKLPNAKLKKAYVLAEMGKKEEAKEILEDLLLLPDREVAELARKKLEALEEDYKSHILDKPTQTDKQMEEKPVEKPVEKKTVEHKVVESKPDVKLYRQALESYKKQQYDKTREILHQLIQEYPTSKYYDNALYWIGQSYYREGRNEKALEYFNRVIEECEAGVAPDCSKLPMAKLKKAYVLTDLCKSNEAKKILKEIINEYPNKEVALLAKKLLDNLESR